MRPRERCVRGGPMRRFFVALRALVYMTGFVLFWGWIALSAREFDRSFGVLLPAWTETLGIIFMPVGGLLALTCAAVFIARGRGTPAPFDPPEEFLARARSEEHTSELQSLAYLVCRLLLEKKKKTQHHTMQ